MSENLSIIAGELRRLQREGVDRIFVDDATVEILSPAAAPLRGALAGNRQSPETAGKFDPAQKPSNPPDTDLRSLIDAPAKSGPEPKSKKENPASLPTLPDQPPKVVLPEGDAAKQLAHLKKQVMACPTCNANLNPKGKIVFGSGHPSADIFFCGEAPGADEELSGTPFVGKAGQLLDKIISAMGLERDEVYIANILNWHPQHDKPYGNRPPTNEEMRFCLPYLEAQIDIVRPKVIIALGNAAVTGLLGPDPKRKMGSVRGTWHQFKETPLMITFHPSYLLRNGTLKTKRMVWEDMLEVMERCNLPISERQRGFFLSK